MDVKKHCAKCGVELKQFANMVNNVLYCKSCFFKKLDEDCAENKKKEEKNG